MKKVVIVVGLLIGFSVSLHAVKLIKTGSHYEDFVGKLINNFVNPMLSSDFSSKKTTDNISVIIAKDGGTISSLNVAYADPNSQRIVISDGFINGLEQYISAYLIGEKKGNSYLTEDYMNYMYWRQRPLNDGDLHMTPEKWSNYTPANLSSFKRNQGGLFATALVDILLHEVGHHVTNGFYDRFSSKNKIRKIERKADEWAEKTLSEEFKGATTIGRFFAVGYIFELDRIYMFSKNKTHPPHFQRVASTTDGLCSELDDDKKSLCEKLKQDIKQKFNAPLTENSYKERIEEGEAYAHFPLANILLSKGKRKEACEHYLKAWKNAKVERASIHVGSCYDNIYLKNRANTGALIKAKEFYNIAADLGFVDAKVYIKKYF